MMQKQDSINSKSKQLEDELRKIEWLLTKSFGDEELYNPSYGNLAELNTARLILDSVGEDILIKLADDYISLLGTSGAIYEKNGDYALGIFSSGWCQFLDNASRNLCDTDNNTEALASGNWHCHESCWSEASKTSIETGQPVDIECNGGIHLYAVPIWAGNEIVGSVNVGWGDPPINSEKLQQIAEKFSVNVGELSKKSRAYESRPAFIIQMAKRRIHTAAMLIGEIVERKRVEQKLETEIFERKKIEADMRSNMEDLERFSALVIDREEQMIKLKEEINNLLLKMGRKEKYKIAT